MTNLFFDVLIAVLLVMAIVFCLRLNGRLKSMRQMGAELTPFMKNMSGYLGQISQSIDKLKQVADLGNQGLNEHIPVAINLKDDFDLLLEHSDKMARRLDEVIEKAREMEQRLQQTVRVSEGARSGDRRIEPVLQRGPERPQQGSSPQQNPPQQQKNVSKNHPQERPDDRMSTTARPYSTPPLGLDDEMDFFVPSQSRHSGENKFTSEKEREMDPKRSHPVDRGIMAKLRGLR